MTTIFTDPLSTEFKMKFGLYPEEYYRMMLGKGVPGNDILKLIDHEIEKILNRKNPFYEEKKVLHMYDYFTKAESPSIFAKRILEYQDIILKLDYNDLINFLFKPIKENEVDNCG